MKTPLSIALLAATTALFVSGCVSRTVRSAPGGQVEGGSAENGEAYGFSPKPKVVEKKIVWIWQKEYREQK